MCLISFGLRKYDPYFLVLAANRDEFYERPTASSQWWGTQPDILAGRDQIAGGTWLGINQLGYWAALTNVRAPGEYDENAPSRGDLVRNYLENTPNPRSYLVELTTTMKKYNGFNLLVGNSLECWYLTNSVTNAKPKSLTQGLYGLSNAQLDVPWPKVEKACARLDAHFQTHSQVNREELIRNMVDQQEATEGELPDTGVPNDLEKKLSAMFIQTPEYGTRCTTVLTIRYDGTVHWREHSYQPGTKEIDSITDEQFQIQSG